ncbi:MAG: DNA primase [Nitrospiraceae bacterium]|nr:DNA primase [Nitrospiraceae bacterium]
MGRGLISDDVINQIRDRVDIAEIVGQHVALTRAGQNLKGLCPFHQEKSPSFNVSPSRQIFHCFGCGAGGNVFSFLMKLTGAPFPEVVRDLGRKAGVDVPESAGGYSSQERNQMARLEQLNVAAGSWFHGKLLENPSGAQARAYLEGRGILPETIEQFRIGYAPAEWDALAKSMLREGFTAAELVAAGLAVPREQSAGQRGPGTGQYDRFRSRVMFPILDLRKRVVAFGGRVLGDGTPKYLNSPDTPLFKKGQTLFALEAAREAASQQQTLIIVEGYFDAIALHQAGICHVAATLGTALTAEHITVIRRFASKVVLLFDPDAAGVRAALRSLDLFVNSGIGVTVVSLPTGDDPDTFVRKFGPAGFAELAGRAPSLLDFAVEHSLQTAESGTVEDRIRAVDAVLRILQKGAHPIEREERIRVVAERLGLSQQRLIDRYPALVADDQRKPTVRTQALPVPKPKSHPEERDLAHLLVQGSLAPADVRKLEPESFAVPTIRRIVESGLRHVGGDGRVAVRALLDELVDDPECGPLVTELSMEELHYDDVPAHTAGCLETLARKCRERALHQLIQELKAAERERRDQDVRRLNQQINEMRMQKAGVSLAALAPAVKE